MFLRRLICGGIISAAIVIGIVIGLSACVPEGSIVIVEDIGGKGFKADLYKFNAENKCEILLAKGSVLQVEVENEEGKITLTVTGKRGSSPYTGNDLQSGIFTFAVSETDQYIFQIKGTNATGKITVKNLGVDAQ
jgi:hypothetical protein